MQDVRPRPVDDPQGGAADGVSGPRPVGGASPGRGELEGENPAFAGDPAELRDHLARLYDLGFDLVQLSFASFPETDDLKLFADEVIPHFS